MAHRHDNLLRKGLSLAVPFSANIGGIGTPIASPPNAVAYSLLAKEGFPVSFFNWEMIAVPLMLLLLWLTLLLLYLAYMSIHKDITFKPQKNKIEARGWYVIAVLVLTVILCLTESIHGLSSTIMKGELVSKDFMRNGFIIGGLSLLIIYAIGSYIINF